MQPGQQDKGTGSRGANTAEATAQEPLEALLGGKRAASEPGAKERSLDSSLEAFIARANSTFIERDGWKSPKDALSSSTQARPRALGTDPGWADAIRADVVYAPELPADAKPAISEPARHDTVVSAPPRMDSPTLDATAESSFRDGADTLPGVADVSSLESLDDESDFDSVEQLESGLLRLESVAAPLPVTAAVQPAVIAPAVSKTASASRTAVADPVARRARTATTVVMAASEPSSKKIPMLLAAFVVGALAVAGAVHWATRGPGTNAAAPVDPAAAGGPSVEPLAPGPAPTPAPREVTAPVAAPTNAVPAQAVAPVGNSEPGDPSAVPAPAAAGPAPAPEPQVAPRPVAPTPVPAASVAPLPEKKDDPLVEPLPEKPVPTKPETKSSSGFEDPFGDAPAPKKTAPKKPKKPSAPKGSIVDPFAS